jgi:hypothetical protein
MIAEEILVHFICNIERLLQSAANYNGIDSVSLMKIVPEFKA